MVLKLAGRTILRGFRFLQKLGFYSSLVVMILVIFPGFPPYVSFKSFRVTPAIKLEGHLSPNYILDEATKFLDGEIVGAESIVVKGNVLYTGVKGGRLLMLEDKLSGGKELKHIASTGKPCKAEPSEDPLCGLPLGIREDSNENLIVADAYYGIVKIDPETGDVNHYFSMEVPIEGKVPKIPTDLDVARDDTVYWSDFSSDYKIENKLTIERIGDSSGRLIKLDPKTNENTVLYSGLYGANGVQLSENEDFVLVSEFYKYRVIRYYLKGSKAGTSDVFVDGLPGAPDNIRPNGRGGFYVTLYMPRVPMSDELSRLPQLRKLLFRMRWITLSVLAIYDKINIRNSYIDLITDYIYNFGDLGFIQDGKSTIVELDAKGNILQVLKTNKNEMSGISQITVGKDYAYMGGPDIDEIWKINVAQLQGKDQSN